MLATYYFPSMLGVCVSVAEGLGVVRLRRRLVKPEAVIFFLFLSLHVIGSEMMVV